MKFCFFGNISGALKGRTPGGAELQISLLARALALKGHEVVIIDPYSSESFVTEEGVRLINVPGWNKGMRGMRLFLHRIPALKKIFAEQNADYYYVRMRNYFHLLSYRAAKRNGGKFIHAIANEMDLMGFWGKFRYKYRDSFNFFRFLTLDLPNDWVTNYLLKRSDYIILQHVDQKVRMRRIKGQVRVFPNIFNFSKVHRVNNPSKDYFIQVGTVSLVKGSENLFKLIQEIDKSTTIMIVGQPVDPKSEKIYRDLHQFENIQLKGRLKHDETMRLISNAKALISTSNFEGFPNIFLEAWAAGVPVISLKVNPGNVINAYHLGVCCEGDLKKMATCIDQDITAPIDKEKLISYVSEFHDFAKAGDRFLNIITNH
jgi:glycosyltransferase involved in cell wall biosynthesis